MCNELKRDRIRIFREDSLRTNKVIISSHGAQRANRQGYNPGGITFYMDPRYGAETRGTLDDWLNRYENEDLHQAGGQNGAVGDYVLTKFQGYHHAAPYPFRRVAHFFRLHAAAERYQDIRNFVDSDNHDIAVDVATVHNVQANNNGMFLSEVIADLQQVTRRYTEVVLAFCLVQQGYGGYVNALTGQPY